MCAMIEKLRMRAGSKVPSRPPQPSYGVPGSGAMRRRGHAEMRFEWRPYREPVLVAAQYLVQGLLWGALGGFLIAGIGGRLAMLVLRLTSDPALAGTPTDDDFTIGAITGDTLFLLLLGSLAGAMGGVVYSLVRIWLPT